MTEKNLGMRVFFHSAPGRWPMLEFELDMVQQELDKGSDVIYASCFGGQEYCAANNPHPAETIRPARCASCISRVNRGVDWLEAAPGKFRRIEFKSVTEAQEARIQVLRLLVSEGAESIQAVRDRLSGQEDICWRAAESGLATDLRDSKPNLQRYRNRFALLLAQALESLFSMQNHIQRLDVDLVYLYNGRMPRYWPALRAVEEAKIAFKVYEFPRHGFENYLVLEASRVHDTEDFAKKMLQSFSKLSEDKRDIFRTSASQWFMQARNRKMGGAAGIKLTPHLSHVESDNLPNNWPDRHKAIVTFFPSTQYEFAKSASDLNFRPPNQVAVIRACLQEFSMVLFYVRVHPAQPSSDREFLESLNELNKFPNCTILPSNSRVDSLTLGLESNLAVTFGSTVGVQLAWEGQRVIEYGAPFYSMFGAAQNVQTLDKLFEAVRLSSTDGAQKPEVSTEAREGAVIAIASIMALGKTPKYLRKNSFYGGHLVRNGRAETIKPRAIEALLERVETFFREPRRSILRVFRRLVRPPDSHKFKSSR